MSNTSLETTKQCLFLAVALRMFFFPRKLPPLLTIYFSQISIHLQISFSFLPSLLFFFFHFSSLLVLEYKYVSCPDFTFHSSCTQVHSKDTDLIAIWPSFSDKLEKGSILTTILTSLYDHLL